MKSQNFQQKNTFPHNRQDFLYFHDDETHCDTIDYKHDHCNGGYYICYLDDL